MFFFGGGGTVYKIDFLDIHKSLLYIIPNYVMTCRLKVDYEQKHQLMMDAGQEY